MGRSKMIRLSGAAKGKGEGSRGEERKGREGEKKAGGWRLAA
jgi:hypothetical protein